MLRLYRVIRQDLLHLESLMLDRSPQDDQQPAEDEG